MKNKQVMVEVDRLSPSSMKFLSMQVFDKILNNHKNMTKSQIVEYIACLRDEYDRMF